MQGDMPTFGSLFAGIGGIDLGLERAGWECRFQVEWDEWCQRVLAKHWPDIKRYGDITAVDWSTVEPVDLLAGGFPCQPFSLAGQRRGKSDERWLWPEFATAIRHLRPRYVLVENVPGLLAGHGGMGAVLGDLADLGYDARWDCIPAAAVGAPHLRYRVWIVAHANAAELRLQPAGLAGSDHSAITGDDGADRTLADTDGQGSQGRQVQPERAGQRPVGPGGLGDSDGSPADAYPAGRGSRGAASEPGRWEPEPDVGRVVARFPAGLDGSGGVNGHAGCIAKARSTGVPGTERLRALREFLGSPAASSEPERCAFCGHPLPGLPCGGTCAPWYMGAGNTPDEDMRCLREGVYALGSREAGEALFARVPRGNGATSGTQTLARRVDRLRGLGNAVVPQVVEVIGRRLLEAEAQR